MLKKIIFIIVSILLFNACKNYTAQIDNEKREILRVHDVLMPKMDSLYALKKQVVELKNTLPKLSNSEKSYMDSVSFALVRADDAMTNWMAQWKDPDDNGVTEQAALNYLAAQKEIVLTMQIKFKKALTEGKETVAKYTKK